MANEAERGIIFNKAVVVKPGRLPEFYRECPAELCPDRLIDYVTAYTYRFQPGRQATVDDIPAILQTCHNYIWQPTHRNILPSVVTAYTEHVQNQAGHLPLTFRALVNEALHIILASTLHEVRLNHGDLTLENVIITEDRRVIFIDPAGTRGMNCVPNEKGKLLQSFVMRWEDYYSDLDPTPWTEPRPLPHWATELDWAFLVTHWVRLMRFWPERDTVAGFIGLEKARS